MIHGHEVDGARSAMMDDAVAQACILTGDLLARLRLILGGLRLDAQRMRANVDLTGGLISSEAVMLALGATIGRQQAHEIVYEATRTIGTTGASFADVLTADPRVRDHLDEQAIAALLDPASHTGLCPEIARDAAARARGIAAQVNGTRTAPS